MPTRSRPSVPIATCQPAPSSPSRQSAGMRTSVNHTSLNISSPTMSRIGRHSMPGVLHVDDERGDALVLRAPLDRRGIGAEEEQPPLREVRGGDPDLLAVDDVLVAVADRGGAKVGEVGTGLRLAEALAPVLVGREDAGQPPLLLLLGAPRDDHRADLPDAVGVVDPGRADARAVSSEYMTFCTGVASRPPHDFGQLIAAQRPSLRRRCQSLRRSWRARDPRLPARRRDLRRRPSRRGTSAGSRRATPAARRGTPRLQACRRSPSAGG